MKMLTDILAQFDEPEWGPYATGALANRIDEHNRTVAKMRALVEALRVALETGDMPDDVRFALERVIADKLAELI